MHVFSHEEEEEARTVIHKAMEAAVESRGFLAEPRILVHTVHGESSLRTHKFFTSQDGDAVTA